MSNSNFFLNNLMTPEQWSKLFLKVVRSSSPTENHLEVLQAGHHNKGDNKYAHGVEGELSLPCQRGNLPQVQ